jgi:uncharacterized membrane protein
MVVTFSVNLPLNDALAGANVTASNATKTWREYAQRWTAGNHVRVASSTVTLLLLIFAGMLGRR